MLADLLALVRIERNASHHLPQALWLPRCLALADITLIVSVTTVTYTRHMHALVRHPRHPKSSTSLFRDPTTLTQARHDAITV